MFHFYTAYSYFSADRLWMNGAGINGQNDTGILDMIACAEQPTNIHTYIAEEALSVRTHNWENSVKNRAIKHFVT